MYNTVLLTTDSPCIWNVEILVSNLVFSILSLFSFTLDLLRVEKAGASDCKHLYKLPAFSVRLLDNSNLFYINTNISEY